MDITYKYVGAPNATTNLQYEITIAFYYDCQNASWAANAPPSFELRWNDWPSSTNWNYNAINLPYAFCPSISCARNSVINHLLSHMN